ncbi:Shedu immune nuclease family protein [Fluviicola taffensis]|uniref:Shedu immune nuclease family protein n=1 Tax=Fluviicola taffensis TaxID=191579 RepID=UPI0031383096
MASFIGERQVKETTKVITLNYIDQDKKINQLSAEIFKTIDQIIHYPRGFNGGSKYKKIERFTYKGFKNQLPVGIVKSSAIGYGFTRQLKKFGEFVDNHLDVKEIIIEKGGKIEIDTKNKILYLNEHALKYLKDSSEQLSDRYRVSNNLLLQEQLNKLFPKAYKKPTKKYKSNSIFDALSKWSGNINDFSIEDQTSLQDLFEKLTLTPSFFSASSLAKTKEIIDSSYIKQTLDEFRTLIAIKTDGDRLEAKWQEFLHKHSWIFSAIFTQPVILFKREAYVGGKNMDNKDGKFNDFLLQNTLSENVTFLEIKTHKTDLMEEKPYRGSDVFAITKDLSGAIGQVLNQRDNFQKEYYTLKGKSDDPVKTLNSKCIVLVGDINSLNKKQKDAFELFRSNSKDAEILTFSELLQKIEAFQTLLSI